MGFQLIYDGQPQDKDMIYFDEQSTICMTTDIILDVDQKIEDVQIAQVGDLNVSIDVKFVLTGGQEYTCGAGLETFESMIPQDDTTADNALLYLYVELMDFSSLEFDLGLENYLYSLKAAYIDLNKLT